MATQPYSLANYNINPAPTTGQGAYGLVPAQVGLPPSVFSQMTSNVPMFGQMTNQAAQNINTELSGQLSPSAISQIQNQAAAQGITSGMPNSGMQQSDYLRSLGLTSEALTQQGNKDYLSFLGGVGAAQTDPNLAASVAERNALMAAAPDPSQAAAALQDTYMKNLQAQQSLNRGVGGGYQTPAGTGYGGGGSGYGGFQQWVAANPFNTYSGSPYSVSSFGGSPYTVSNFGGSSAGNVESYGSSWAPSVDYTNVASGGNYFNAPNFSQPAWE